MLKSSTWLTVGGPPNETEVKLGLSESRYCPHFAKPAA